MTHAADASRPNWVRTGPRDAGTVLLIHSLGLDLTYWDRQIEALAPAYDVVAVDLPGHGRSAALPSGSGFDDVAATIAALVEQIGTAPVHVVGVSVGGMIAQALVLAHPQLVRSLSLLSTAATFADEARARVRTRRDAVAAGGMAAATASLKQWLTAETMTRRPDLVDRITKTLMADDPAPHVALLSMVAEIDLIDRLGEVRCPTLALTCADDVSTPPACSTAIAERIAGARAAVLPGGAHLAHLEQPAAVNAELLRFLGGV